MGRGNPENLHIPTSEEAQKIGSKGGIASGIARKRRKGIKNAVQAILDEKYTDEDGKERTGEELLAIRLYEVAIDTTHKQFVSAQRLIYEITGQDKTAEDKKRIKLAIKQAEKDIELTQKKIDSMF